MLHGATPHTFQTTLGLAVEADVHHFNRTCSSRSRGCREMFNDVPVLLGIARRNPRLLIAGCQFLRCIGVFLVSIFYMVSPVDVLPEIVFGPVGLIDDVIVLALGLILISEIIRRSIRSVQDPAR